MYDRKQLRHYNLRNAVRCINIFLITDEHVVNTLRPEQNGRRVAVDNLKLIFMCELCILTPIELKFVTQDLIDKQSTLVKATEFVHKALIDNNSSLIQLMVWRRTSDNSLFEARGNQILRCHNVWTPSTIVLSQQLLFTPYFFVENV